MLKYPFFVGIACDLEYVLLVSCTSKNQQQPTSSFGRSKEIVSQTVEKRLLYLKHTPG